MMAVAISISISLFSFIPKMAEKTHPLQNVIHIKVYPWPSLHLTALVLCRGLIQGAVEERTTED